MENAFFHSTIKLIIVGCCLLLPASTTQATDYYVSTSGNDASAGNSPGTPWRTIQKAADTAVAGDTVYVADGTYNEAVTLSHDGTAANPIRFVASTPGNAIIDSATYPTLHFDGDDHIHFEGFTVVGVHVLYKSAVLLYQSTGIVFTNCDVSNSYHGFDTESSELTVISSAVHDCSRELFMPRTGTTLVIRDSELYNSYEDAIHGTTTTGGTNPNSTTITVAGCRIHDNGRHGIRTSRCRATITNCLIYNNGYGAAGYGFGIHSFDYSDTTVEHCTIVNNQQYGIRTKPAGATTLRNSIVANNGDFGLRGDVSGAFTATTDYNLLFANSNGNYMLVTPGANDVLADPEFLGAADYHLQSTSPAVDAGVGAASADLDGKPRPYGAAVDIGCYEAGPSVYYVRVTGDDSNHGMSPTQAFRSISRAASILTADTIIHVGGGTYLETVTVAEQGTSAKPIRFVADTTGAQTGDAGPVIVTPTVDQQYGWSLENSAFVTLEGFRTSGLGMSQPNGLFVDQSQSITIRDCEIDNTLHGIYGRSSTLILENCHVHDTTTAGLTLYATTSADLQVTNLTLTDNGTFGLFLEASDLSFDATNIGDWSISGSQTAIGGTSSTLALDGITITGGTTAGVQVTQSNLAATNVTFTGNGYGLAIDASDVVLTSCTFSANTVGLYATQNASLTVSDGTFSGNSLWGASVTPSGIAGETATFSACTFHSNAGGLALVNAVDGDVLLRAATVIRDNAAAGLHFDQCSLTANDQAGGANWTTLRNQYGISCSQSTLTLSDLQVQESTSYGILCQDSTVVVTNCTLTGSYGIYADAANDALTVSKSTLTSGVTPGWGIVRYGGDLELKNTIVNGYWLGLYLAVAAATDDASILNSTLSDISGYGVYLISGDALVQNTILYGSGVGYGLVRSTGTMTHSHNLIDNFTTAFHGTTADPTELEKSPRFVDAANGDFHLRVGSPAINAGLDLGLTVPDDMEGNVRPSFNGYEMGAYEFEPQRLVTGARLDGGPLGICGAR